MFFYHLYLKNAFDAAREFKSFRYVSIVFFYYYRYDHYLIQYATVIMEHREAEQYRYWIVSVIYGGEYVGKKG